MKKLTAILLVAMICVLPFSAMAQGAAELSFSGDASAEKGESIAIIVTFCAEERIAALQATFTYDTQKLAFLSGGNSAQAENGIGSISGGGGAAQMSYTLEFRAIDTGTAAVAFSDVEIVGDISGTTLGSPSGAFEIEITAPSAQEPSETPAATPQPSLDAEEHPEEEASQADVIVIDGKKYTPTDAQLNGYRLLGDEDGVLWLYRTSDGQMMQYCPVETHALYQPEELPLLDGYRKETITIDGNQWEAYVTENGGYLLYLREGTQAAAWYGYEPQTGLLRKARVEEQVIRTVTKDENAWLYTLVTMLTAGLCVVALIGLILILRRKAR